MELTLLAPLCDLLQEELVDAFALRRTTIPPQFAEHHGTWNGRELKMSTQVYKGAGAIEELHVARVGGAMESFTLIAWTPASQGRRVLGVDVVAFGGAISTAVFDITPTDAELASETVLELHRLRTNASSFSEPRAWSDEAPSPFSENVIFISPRRGEDARVVALAAQFIALFVREVSEAPGANAPGGPGLVTYLGRLSQSKKQMRVLAKLFGEDWVGPYFDSVFFNPSLSPVNVQ